MFESLIETLHPLWGLGGFVEIIGALLALLYLWLEIRQRNAMWIVGILSSLFYVYIFYHAKIYADMGMNVYYALASFYGLYRWKHPSRSTKSGEERSNILTVMHTPLKTAMRLAIIAVALWGAITFVLTRFTDSPVPYIDSIITTLSIIATWMLAQKYIEQWWVWTAVNVISTGLFFYRGLYPTMILYAIYSMASVIGSFQWRKTMV